nr:hypothetical protein [uncultured Mucilaginibacter sp.]
MTDFLATAIGRFFYRNQDAILMAVFVFIVAISAVAAYFASKGLLHSLKRSGNKHATFWSVLTFILSFFATLLIILMLIAMNVDFGR